MNSFELCKKMNNECKHKDIIIPFIKWTPEDLKKGRDYCYWFWFDTRICKSCETLKSQYKEEHSE